MKKLLIEGPVGHMWHPFDLDQVKTGKDLLSVFENEVVELIILPLQSKLTESTARFD